MGSVTIVLTRGKTMRKVHWYKPKRLSRLRYQTVHLLVNCMRYDRNSYGQLALSIILTVQSLCFSYSTPWGSNPAPSDTHVGGRPLFKLCVSESGFKEANGNLKAKFLTVNFAGMAHYASAYR